EEGQGEGRGEARGPAGEGRGEEAEGAEGDGRGGDDGRVAEGDDSRRRARAPRAIRRIVADTDDVRHGRRRAGGGQRGDVREPAGARGTLPRAALPGDVDGDAVRGDRVHGVRQRPEAVLRDLDG